MCENVIIHRNDGKEILCEDQHDLNLYMRKGLCFKPPLTYADMSRYWSSVYPKEQLPKIHDPLGDLEHGYKPFSCLCPVDLRQTAVLNGFRYSKEFPDGEYDPFDIHFYLSQNDSTGGKKMLNEKLENPYLIGVLSGIATTLMATGISMSYCTVSLDELFYGGIFIFILSICIIFYQKYKNKAVKNNG